MIDSQKAFGKIRGADLEKVFSSVENKVIEVDNFNQA